MLCISKLMLLATARVKKIADSFLNYSHSSARQAIQMLELNLNNSLTLARIPQLSHFSLAQVIFS